TRGTVPEPAGDSCEPPQCTLKAPCPSHSRYQSGLGSAIWCGGWDSNPRRPSPQGPKPRAGYDHAFCPLDLALVPPQISEARTTPRPWANKDYLAAHIATISFPGPSDDKGRSPACRIGTAWGRR